MNSVIETQPYVVPRLRLAYIAAEEYVRSFWFFVLGIPLGGVALVAFGDRSMQVIGMFALLWPFSIPARAILITNKASRLFASGAWMRAGEEEIEFLGTKPGANGKPLRMAISRDLIRDVVTRQGMYLVRTYRLNFAPVDPSAFRDEPSRDAFIRSLNQTGE